MHNRLLSPRRRGFTIIETLVALVLTAVIGAAVTGVFITQSTFFDTQEKVGAARAVSRGASNVMMSELRMVEQTGGVVAATSSSITVRVPYAMGVACDASSNLIVSLLPVDEFVLDDAGYSGYAYRDLDGTYNYVEGGAQPANASESDCTAVNVTVLTADGGDVVALAPGSTVDPGTPVLLYQILTYEFKASGIVPGRIGLWREIDETGQDEELVAPVGPAARFRFYVDDDPAADNDPPADLSTITGLELVLDGMSERPRPDGSFQRVPFQTSVFFRNRM